MSTPCGRMMSITFFFFNDTATTEIYTLSLHDALPISAGSSTWRLSSPHVRPSFTSCTSIRSEEHTSELQSPDHLVCRLLLEKKNDNRDSPSSFKNVLCFAVDSRICISIFINSLCVADI